MSSSLYRQSLGRHIVQRMVSRHGSTRKGFIGEAVYRIAGKNSSRGTPSSFHQILSFHSTALRNENSETKDTLLAILKREHKEEITNQTTTLPEELADLKTKLTKKGWKIVDEADSAITKMVRTSGKGLKIQLSFHCQDMVEGMDGSYEGDEDGIEASLPIRFTVIASKAGQTIVMGCLSEHATAAIQSVAITGSSDEASLLKNGSVPAEEYQGPEFSELAEDLQAAFSDFVEFDVGIDEDVASFIAMYADFKEQCKYVEFLDKTKSLLE